MLRTLLQQLLLVVILCVTYSDHSFGQKISFGAVTGAQLTDDFRTLFCPDLKGSQFPPPPGCPHIIGGSIGVSNASKAFIFGPKLNVRFSPSFSVEVDALRRPIRTNTTTSFSFCPSEQLPSCDSPVSLTRTSQGTEFTWKFPVLARYQWNGRKLNPFLEGGPSFRPAENREQTGITAGGGVEMRLRSIRLSPSLRYTHWADNGKYIGENREQLQFVLGIDGPTSEETVTVFGHKLTLGAVTGVALKGGLQTRTITFTDALVQDPVTRLLVPVDGTQIQNANRTSPVIGIETEYDLPNGFSLAFSALYRPLNAKDFSSNSSGFTSTTKFVVLTWEFPLLAKYKLPILENRPFIELGPSFRSSGNLNGADPSVYGITGGIGVQLPRRGVALAPTFRFTHWAPDGDQTGTPTHRNQLELIFGIRF